MQQPLAISHLISKLFKLPAAAVGILDLLQLLEPISADKSSKASANHIIYATISTEIK
jgi:hypothetical protein